MRFVLAIILSILLHGLIVAFAPSVAVAPQSFSPVVARPMTLRLQVLKQSVEKNPPDDSKTVKADPPDPIEVVRPRRPVPEQRVVKQEATQEKTTDTKEATNAKNLDAEVRVETRLVEPAEYLRNPPPVYPKLARMRRHEGMVLVLVDIDEHGRVSKQTLLKSSGFAELDEAAMLAVRKWQFVPSQQAGIPKPVRVKVPLKFELRGS